MSAGSCWSLLVHAGSCLSLLVTVNHCRSLQVPAGPDCPLVGDLHQEDKEKLLPIVSAATGRLPAPAAANRIYREGVCVCVCVKAVGAGAAHWPVSKSPPRRSVLCQGTAGQVEGGSFQRQQLRGAEQARKHAEEPPTQFYTW